tara:strand:- start:2422 stop:2892 length:471 start_codon:yes stop_codon:yes gene_type:complete
MLCHGITPKQVNRRSEMPNHNVNKFYAADKKYDVALGKVSGAVKRVLERAFGRVRVRGEISHPRYSASGHLFFMLRDEDTTLDGVCWRDDVGKLGITLEEGMGVICTGQITTYPRSSKYQLVVEAVELTGEGVTTGTSNIAVGITPKQVNRRSEGY